MKCIALQHVAFENLGVFEAVFRQHALDIEYRQAGVHPLSDAEWTATDLVVVLGGPVGVYDDEAYPWLKAEIDGMARRLNKDKPTVGICLGAQIMATALGGRVYPGKQKEIGWDAVSLNTAGLSSCLSTLRDIPVLHWHGDTFEIPSGAQLLASTELTPNQAFSVGQNALALQFHPEADGRAIEPWLIGHTCELIQAGIPIKTLRAASMRHADQAATAGKHMMESWLGQSTICN